jgi:predicted acetyltransferase
MTSIRHTLNEALMKRGGHIAYGVRPTERGKGYANEILHLGLEKLDELGVDKALLTCDKSNLASVKTIQHNGGILENEYYDQKE